MTKHSSFQVIEPGTLTTVQDLGRGGWTGIGVPTGGAADSISLRLGNRLAGNDDAAAALEITVSGGTFEFEWDSLVVLAGARIDARIDGQNGVRLAPAWMPFEIARGERLVTGPIRNGIRTYLCIAGGVIVPPVLASRSTHLGAGFGGIEGRALRKGDLIECGDDRAKCGDSTIVDRARVLYESLQTRRSVRAVDGAHVDTFDAKAVESFYSSTFEVSSQIDRAALRLNGPIQSAKLGGRMPSEGMMHGAVQVPESGQPIVLMVDYPTTGGYPVIACVAAVDHAVLGQLGPRDTVQFERINRDDARALYQEQEHRIEAEVPRP